MTLAPQQALFLGLGTGSTIAAAAVFPELKAEGVEPFRKLVGLVGGRQKLSFPEKWYDKRTQSKEIRRHIGGAG